MEKIKSLLEKRKSHYDSIPTQVDTTNLNVEEVVEKITSL